MATGTFLWVYQWLDDNGAPLADGTLTFYNPGTAVLATVCSDAELTTPASNPFSLDAAGRSRLFLGLQLYDVTVKDVNGVQVGSTLESIGSPANIALQGLGNTQATGGKAVSTGYAVLSTDYLVTVNNGASAASINLPAAAVRSTTNTGNGFPLIIMNFGTGALTVTPNGADKINGLSTITIAASASPTFHWVYLFSDGVSNWYGLQA